MRRCLLRAPGRCFAGGLAALLLYGAREMHRETQALAAALAQHPVMQALPPREAWRLCVDQPAVGDGLHAGLRFDNEPGYMAGMYRALAQMVLQEVRGIVLDAGSLVDLHDTAVHGVFARVTLEQGLALEQGLPPAALEDANRLDAFSVAEVVQEIRTGQGRFALLAWSAVTRGDASGPGG